MLSNGLCQIINFPFRNKTSDKLWKPEFYYVFIHNSRKKRYDEEYTLWCLINVPSPLINFRKFFPPPGPYLDPPAY